MLSSVGAPWRGAVEAPSCLKSGIRHERPAHVLLRQTVSTVTQGARARHVLYCSHSPSFRKGISSASHVHWRCRPGCKK
jgi:hypothetical protein